MRSDVEIKAAYAALTSLAQFLESEGDQLEISSKITGRKVGSEEAVSMVKVAAAAMAYAGGCPDVNSPFDALLNCAGLLVEKMTGKNLEDSVKQASELQAEAQALGITDLEDQANYAVSQLAKQHLGIDVSPEDVARVRDGGDIKPDLTGFNISSLNVSSHDKSELSDGLKEKANEELTAAAKAMAELSKKLKRR